MLRKLSRRVSYANVMSTIAVFVAVGTGGAYAANTIGSTDIIDGQVKSVDIGNGEVNSADVKDESLTTFDVSTFLGSDVVDNTLTGADVNESTLNLAAEPWHDVGSAGQPTFNHDDILCTWKNFGGDHNTAGFLRDRFGFVHLKGLVDQEAQVIDPCSTAGDERIFTLPVGYRPARREAHVTITNGALGRINIDGPAAPGKVWIDAPTTTANAQQWVALDGISFRCAPSGSDGCP